MQVELLYQRQVLTESGCQRLDVRGWADTAHVYRCAATEAIVLEALTYGTATKATKT